MPFSGLSSRPFGPDISRGALGNVGTGVIKNRAYPIVVNGPGLQGPPDWYRAMQGASLGDDTQTTGAAQLTDGTSQWQQSMLSEVQGVRAAQEEFTRREGLQRWIQIGATLAIPLSAAIWRAIFRGSRDSGM
jgi:hypothetical protein